MKRETLMVSLVALSGALLAAADDARRAELAARVADDVNVPVRAGGVDGRPFWNVRSIIFMHPPAFDFASVKGAVRYRFTVTDDCLLTHDFTADRPTADLSPVWKDVPVGFANVRVEGVDADGKAIGIAGERRFWRSAPYEPGTYPDRPWGYDECARRYLNTLFDHPNTRHFRETGAPDGVTDLLNIYPSKMNSALIRGLLRLAGLDRRRRDAAIATAKRVGEYMLSISQPASAPLAHFPPTYWPMKGQKTNMASIEYAGQVMLVYPAQVGQAYLALHKATGESRWLEAATGIAKTYERLQLPNGTWYLKMWEKDGKPVIGGNGKKPVELIPLGVCMFAEALAERTGDAHWRKLADRAFASIDEGALKTYAFAPQFEDTPPTANYRDLTSSLPLEIAHYLLRRFPADPARRAQVRELLRWVEDQFIVWRRPFRADGRGILSEPWHGFNPCWGAVCTPASCGQRCECYPVDVWFEAAGVLEKYRWTVRENSLTALAASVFHRLGQLEQDELLLAKARTLGDSVVCVQQMGGDGEIATEWFSHNLTGVSCPRNWTNCGVGAALYLLELEDDNQVHVSIRTPGVPELKMESLSCEDRVLPCGKMSLDVPSHAYLAADPANERYSYAGYVVSNAMTQVGEGGAAARHIVVDLVRDDGPYVVCLKWTNREVRRSFISAPEAYGTFKLNGRPVGSSFDIWGVPDVPLTSVIEFVPAAGCTFAGWSGSYPRAHALGNPATCTSSGRYGLTVRVRGCRTMGEPVRWTGRNGRWEDAGNWSGGKVPTLLDDVRIVGGSVSVSESFAAKSLTLSGAVLTIGETGCRRHVFGTVAGDVDIIGSAEMKVWASQPQAVDTKSPQAFQSSLYDQADTIRIGGALRVGAGSRLEIYNDPLTGLPVIFRTGSASVSAGGEITATGGGFGWMRKTDDALFRGAFTGRLLNDDFDYATLAFGRGENYGGGGYGGRATDNGQASGAGCTYGFETAPLLPGAPSGIYFKREKLPRGGGTVCVLADGVVAVEGRILAQGRRNSQEGGASGGAIWLSGSDVTVGKQAVVSADGEGCPSFNAGAGGGGRILFSVDVQPAVLDALVDGKAPEELGLEKTKIVSPQVTVAGGAHPGGVAKNAKDGTKVQIGVGLKSR